MRVKIYGMIGCSSCKEMVKFCEDQNVSYEYIEDLQELKKLASEHHILSAPIVMIGDLVYGKNGAMHRIYHSKEGLENE